MVIFASNGDLIVQGRNKEACQWLEYSALQVLQYCKETKDRKNRLYDLRGTMVCYMAGDLKEFVKEYISENRKKKNYENHVSSSMIIAIHDALEIFSEVYNSMSSKKYTLRLEQAFPVMFKYKRVVDLLMEKLVAADFYVYRCDSASSSSVYFDIDYGKLSPIRVSDHYVEYEGIQLLVMEEKPEEAGSNGVYHIKTDFNQESMEKVVDFIVQRLVSERFSVYRSQYAEYLKSVKDAYKDKNVKYQEVVM